MPKAPKSERGKVIALSKEPGDVMCHNYKRALEMVTLILRMQNPKQKERLCENLLQVFNDYQIINMAIIV